MTIALIPVKRLEESKSRLLSHLPGKQREALTLAMLEDLLQALTRAQGLDRVAVTTPDPVVAERTRAAGAEVLMRPEPGLNAALEDGRERLAPKADEAFMIVLGDVAGATTRDFERMIEHAADLDGACVVLAASSDGGTSALLRRPADVIPCRFGRDSARLHREAAHDAGVAYVELELGSLEIDLDQPEDLEAFMKTSGGGKRTRALLSTVFASHTPPDNDTDGEEN